MKTGLDRKITLLFSSRKFFSSVENVIAIRRKKTCTATKSLLEAVESEVEAHHVV